MKKSIFVLLFLAFANFIPAQTSAIYNLRSDTVDVLHYNVTLEIKDFVINTIKGNTVITLSPKMPAINKICFDLLQLSVDSVVYNTTHLATSYNDTLLVCHFPSVINDNDTIDVKVYYHGTPKTDPQWGGFYFSGGYAYNLGVGFESVPHNFGRTWHPCFDNFVERATYETTITTTGGKVAYCNGVMVSETVSGSDVTRKWVMNDPIPTYLAGVAVNSYTHVNQRHVSTVTGDTIPITLISLPADTTDFKTSFVNLPAAITTFEEHFHPFEWDKVGFVAVPFSAGAMEHATMIAYPLATLTGTTTYQTLMAHELSHHWWGDLVTCETAEDMWINEGFARWCEALFLEKLSGYNAGYLPEIRANHKQVVWKAHVEDGGFFPISGVPQNVTYGKTTYDKGADMVHTLRGYLGDSLFFGGLQSIQQNFKFKNINAIQFRDHLNTYLGGTMSVTDYFNDWVLQPGFPEFSVDSVFQLTGSSPYSVNVQVRQKQRGATHPAVNVPLTVTLMDNNFNTFRKKVMMGTGVTVTTISNIPFVPVIAFLNEDEKISEAVTAQQQFITTAGNKLFSNANFNFQVQSIGDSVWARIEQHWVAADQFSPSNFLYTISPDRFWRIHLLGDVANFSTKGSFTYNGNTSASGNLDNGLMAALSPGFNEDSLRLFYRANPSENWTMVTTATFNMGSKTDKAGTVSIDQLKAGDYALGIKTSAVGITETKGKTQKFLVYPNPANGMVTVELKDLNLTNGNLVVIDQNGSKVLASEIRSSKTELNVSGLTRATYFVSLYSNGKLVETSKLVIK